MAENDKHTKGLLRLRQLAEERRSVRSERRAIADQARRAEQKMTMGGMPKKDGRPRIGERKDDAAQELINLVYRCWEAGVAPPRELVDLASKILERKPVDAITRLLQGEWGLSEQQVKAAKLLAFSEGAQKLAETVEDSCLSSKIYENLPNKFPGDWGLTSEQLAYEIDPDTSPEDAEEPSPSPRTIRGWWHNQSFRQAVAFLLSLA